MPLSQYNVYETPLILPLLSPFVDPHNVSTIFDADDTVWPQFEPAARSVGVDPSKLYNFSVQNNRYYTEDEKNRLFQAFRDIRLFEQAQFYPGIEKMVLLHEMGIKVRFKTKSFNQEISEVKRRRFKEAMPFLQNSDMDLIVAGEDHAMTGKIIDASTTFFVDDNPYNIITSNAIYNLLPYKIWNTNLEERERMSGKNFYIMSSLDVIIETIRNSVHYWRESPQSVSTFGSSS